MNVLRSRSTGSVALLVSSVVSCAGASGPIASPSAPPSAATFPVDSKPLPTYRSRRLALSLPLPDGKAWRIDDHSRPELVATHAPTRSRVVVSVFGAEGLVGRGQCEDLARSRNLVPVPAGPSPAALVEDVVAITEGTFDTRIVVSLEPGAGPTGPTGPLRGHVMAFGGFLRKCYVFVYSTEVDGAADEGVLSARLAFVRARVLGGLELEPFDAVKREVDSTVVGPKLAPER